jgi:hypothetical protein
VRFQKYFFIAALSWTISSSANVVLNETLFELNQEIWTSYDLKQFVKAKYKTPLRLDFLNQSADDYELFLATRLLYYQTVDSMSTADLVKFKATQLIGSDHAVEAEVLKIRLLNDITDFKFKTSSTDEKYDMWINYMKKKYNFVSQK